MIPLEIQEVFKRKFDLDIIIAENPPMLSQKRSVELLNTGLEYIEGCSSLHLQQALENEGYSFSVDQVYDLDGMTSPFDNLIIVPYETFSGFQLESFPQLKNRKISAEQLDKSFEHYIFRDGLEHVFGMDEIKPQFLEHALYKIVDEKQYFMRGRYQNHYRNPQITLYKEDDDKKYLVSPTFLRIGIPENESYQDLIKK